MGFFNFFVFCEFLLNEKREVKFFRHQKKRIGKRNPAV
jgi:hypothetical protein